MKKLDVLAAVLVVVVPSTGAWLGPSTLTWSRRFLGPRSSVRLFMPLWVSRVSIKPWSGKPSSAVGRKFPPEKQRTQSQLQSLEKTFPNPFRPCGRDIRKETQSVERPKEPP